MGMRQVTGERCSGMCATTGSQQGRGICVSAGGYFCHMQRDVCPGSPNKQIVCKHPLQDLVHTWSTPVQSSSIGDRLMHIDTSLVLSAVHCSHCPRIIIKHSRDAR